MIFHVTRVDIEKTRAAWPGGSFTPALVLPRKSREHQIWHIVDKPISAADPQKLTWAVASGDEYIRIPMFSYNVSPQGDLALAFTFQLGLICGNLNVGAVDIAHIVTGTPAELVYNTDGSVKHLICWLGVAFTLKD